MKRNKKQGNEQFELVLGILNQNELLEKEKEALFVELWHGCKKKIYKRYNCVKYRNNDVTLFINPLKSQDIYFDFHFDGTFDVSRHLYPHRDLVWGRFKKEFNMDEDELIIFFQKMIDKHTDLVNVVPFLHYSF